MKAVVKHRLTTISNVGTFLQYFLEILKRSLLEEMYLQSSNLSPPSIVLPVSKVGSIVLLVSKVGSIVLPVSKVGSIVLPVSKVGSNNLCNSLVSKQTISESEAIS